MGADRPDNGPANDGDADGADDPFPVPLPDEAPPQDVVDDELDGRTLFEYARSLIPLPHFIRQYKETIPESIPIFIEAFQDERRLVREEQEHRHHYLDRALEAGIELGKSGQYYGYKVSLAVVAAGILISFFGAVFGSDPIGIAGAGLIGAAILGLVTVFVTGRPHQPTPQDQPEKETPDTDAKQPPPG